MRAARGGRSPRPSADFTVFAGDVPACLGAWKKAEAGFPSQHGSDLLGDFEQSSHRDNDKEGLFLPRESAFLRGLKQSGKRRGGQKGAEGGARGPGQTLEAEGSPPSPVLQLA